MRILACILIVFLSCNKPHDPDLPHEEKIADHLETVIGNIDQINKTLKDTFVDREFLISLYEGHEYQPYWFKKNRYTNAADTLIMFMNNAHLFGLNKSYYRIGHLKRALGQKLTPDSAAYYDLLLTDAFLRFMTELHRGKLDPKAETVVYKGRSLRYYLKPLIEHACRRDQISKVVHSFEPPHLQYKALKEKLFQIAVTRNVIYKVGSSGGNSAGEQTIVERTFNDLSRSHAEMPDLIDDTAGVKEFSAKVSYIKENLKKQESYIKANLEKWRWEKRKYPVSYVMVNIASYMLHLYDQNSIIFSSNVVVGKPENPTPELESEITSILVYPQWHVPYSIASKEILPLIQKNQDYLDRQNMVVLDKEQQVVDPNEVDWTEYDQNNLPFLFRQKEGEGNALGVLKFYFPNKHGVYMHDTNDKKYFKRKLRAYSHGCMRVEKPKEFAGYLLRRTNSISTEIDSYLIKRQTKNLKIAPPLPVFVKYFTSEVVADTLHLYPDVYKKDSKLLKFYAL